MPAAARRVLDPGFDPQPNTRRAPVLPGPNGIRANSWVPECWTVPPSRGTLPGMTQPQETPTPATCANCGEAITPNQLGGWFAPRRLAMGAGHRSTLCPDGVAGHAPALEAGGDAGSLRAITAVWR